MAQKVKYGKLELLLNRMLPKVTLNIQKTHQSLTSNKQFYNIILNHLYWLDHALQHTLICAQNLQLLQ